MHFLRLEYGGQLLIGAARSWLQDDSAWSATEHRFRQVCGEAAGQETATCLAGFLATLSRAARRPVYLNHPECFSLSHDEWLIVQMVAAAQAEDAGALDAMLCLLARRHDAGRLRDILATAALHLCDAGLTVPRHVAARAAARHAGPPAALVARA